MPDASPNTAPEEVVLKVNQPFEHPVEEAIQADAALRWLKRELVSRSDQ